MQLKVARAFPGAAGRPAARRSSGSSTIARAVSGYLPRLKRMPRRGVTCLQGLLRKVISKKIEGAFGTHLDDSSTPGAATCRVMNLEPLTGSVCATSRSPVMETRIHWSSRPPSITNLR